MDNTSAMDDDPGMSRQLRMLLATAVVALAATGGALAHPVGHPLGSPAAARAIDCKRSYYKNVSGHCVRRPVNAATAPAGATAKCRDGTYSFSEHASGTCSHHGGVLRWIHHP
jgi:hypothetical protein